MKKLSFDSRMSKKQLIAVLLWLPVHLIVLPMALSVLAELRGFGDTILNLLLYGTGALYMLLVLWRFFRRDFDALCDRPLMVLLLVVGAYVVSRFLDVFVALLLDRLVPGSSNANNDAVIEMVKSQIGPTAALTVFFAPLVEESIFRGAIFGSLRRRSRFLAYTVSILAFALYHVLGDALFDPQQLLFALQYVPAALALAYVYDATDCVWSSIFLHMLSNGIALYMVHAS